MKTSIPLLTAITALTVLAIAGCRSSTANLNQAAGKVAAVERKLSETQDQKVAKAAEFVVATGYALDAVDLSQAYDLETNQRAVNQAKEFNSLAESALANAGYDVPTAREQELAEMVRKLVDANEKLVAQGEKEKAKLVAAFAKLEAKTKKLEAELAEANAKYNREAQKAAQLADTFDSSWFGGKTKRLLTWGGIVSVLGVGGVIALCVLVPAVLPLVIGLLGRALGLIVAMFPKLINLVGVVGKSTLEGVWEGGEKFKAAIAGGEKKTFTPEEVLRLFRASMDRGQDFRDRQIIKALESTYSAKEIAELRQNK